MFPSHSQHVHFSSGNAILHFWQRAAPEGLQGSLGALQTRSWVPWVGQDPPCPVTAATPLEPAPSKGPTADPAFINTPTLVYKHTGAGCAYVRAAAAHHGLLCSSASVQITFRGVLISDLLIFTLMATKEMNTLYNWC